MTYFWESVGYENTLSIAEQQLRWRLGIRHPRSKEALLDTLLLYEGALASSGDYERCILINGVRYGHVLNPKTGWPVRHLAAVSVIGDFCVVAVSASTIAMLKEDQGIDWLRDLGLPHLWVDIHGVSGGSIATKPKEQKAFLSGSMGTRHKKKFYAR